jgi:hypothetical protein
MIPPILLDRIGCFGLLFLRRNFAKLLGVVGSYSDIAIWRALGEQMNNFDRRPLAWIHQTAPQSRLVLIMELLAPRIAWLRNRHTPIVQRFSNLVPERGWLGVYLQLYAVLHQSLRALLESAGLR